MSGRPFIVSATIVQRNAGTAFLRRIIFKGCRAQWGDFAQFTGSRLIWLELAVPPVYFCQIPGKEETKMEAIREHSVDAFNVMHWEGVEILNSSSRKSSLTGKGFVPTGETRSST